MKTKSEIDRIYVTQKIIDHLQAHTYLEIGIREGDSFLPIECPRKIGVDPRPMHPKIAGHIDGQKIMYFQKTSSDFFRESDHLFSTQKIDVALVDGEHSFRQSLLDVESILGHISPHGILIMHDCNPPRAIHATPIEKLPEARKSPDWDKYWTGDVYKTIIYLRIKRRDLRIFVLDCDWGLGIISRGRSGADIHFSKEEISNLPFSFFSKNRKRLLDLKSPEYFFDFLTRLPH